MTTKAVGLALLAAAALFLAAACGGGGKAAPAFTPVGTFVPLEEGLVPVEAGFADANGARLYYEVYGEGEPLLLVPGLGINHLGWADNVPVCRSREAGSYSPQLPRDPVLSGLPCRAPLGGDCAL